MSSIVETIYEFSGTQTLLLEIFLRLTPRKARLLLKNGETPILIAQEMSLDDFSKNSIIKAVLNQLQSKHNIVVEPETKEKLGNV